MNHASAWKRKMSAKTASTAAAARAPAPFPSFVTFAEISALASSISSRTRSEAFSLTSVTTSPSDLSAPLVDISRRPRCVSAPARARARRGTQRPRGSPGARPSWGESSGLLPSGVGRVLVEDLHPYVGREAGGDDRRERSNSGQEPAPHQSLRQVI